MKRRPRLGTRVRRLRPVRLPPLRPAPSLFQPLDSMTSDEMRRQLCTLAGVEPGDLVGAVEVSARDLDRAGCADEAAAFRGWADQVREIEAKTPAPPSASQPAEFDPDSEDAGPENDS